MTGQFHSYDLGVQHYEGSVVEQSYETAADYFWKAAQMGMEEAREMYDQMIADGLIPADYVPKE